MRLSMTLSGIIMARRLVPGIKLMNTVSIIYREAGGTSKVLSVLCCQISMVLISIVERRTRPHPGSGPSKRSIGVT